MSDRYPSPLRPLVWDGTRWVAPTDAPGAPAAQGGPLAYWQAWASSMGLEPNVEVAVRTAAALLQTGAPHGARSPAVSKPAPIACA